MCSKYPSKLLFVYVIEPTILRLFFSGFCISSRFCIDRRFLRGWWWWCYVVHIILKTIGIKWRRRGRRRERY
jgi:hypothetical protein